MARVVRTLFASAFSILISLPPVLGQEAPQQPNPHPDGSFFAYCWQAGYAQDVRSIEQLHTNWTKLRDMDQDIPGWREMRHDNGSAMFAADGTMLDERGNRSVFDDVDE